MPIIAVAMFVISGNWRPTLTSPIAPGSRLSQSFLKALVALSSISPGLNPPNIHMSSTKLKHAGDMKRDQLAEGGPDAC